MKGIRKTIKSKSQELVVKKIRENYSAEILVAQAEFKRYAGKKRSIVFDDGLRLSPQRIDI